MRLGAVQPERVRLVQLRRGIALPAGVRNAVAEGLDDPLHRARIGFEAMDTRAACRTFNILVAEGRKGVDVQYLFEGREVAVDSTAPFRFRFVDKASGRPVPGLRDVRVMSFRAPGHGRTEVDATEVGDGVYEASVRFGDAGAYYVHVASPTLSKNFRDLPYYSVAATAAASNAPR